MSTDEELKNDRRLYGSSFEHVTNEGKRERIEPWRVVILPREGRETPPARLRRNYQADMLEAALEDEQRPIHGDTDTGFPFYLVACTECDTGSRPTIALLTRPPRFVHEDEPDAEREAVRLAGKFRGFEFAVLKAVACAKWSEADGRVKWDEADDPA